jgi:hypothetical protein
MRKEILSTDFSDLAYGLDVILNDPGARQGAATAMMRDLEALPQSEAVDRLRIVLSGISWFNDSPPPTLPEVFRQVVIQNAGYAADRMIAAEEIKRVRAQGAAGGRKKSVGYETRDKELLAEFDLVRGRCHSDLDAATRMVNNSFTDSFGNLLSAAQIRRIVRNRNK